MPRTFLRGPLPDGKSVASSSPPDLPLFPRSAFKPCDGGIWLNVCVSLHKERRRRSSEGPEVIAAPAHGAGAFLQPRGWIKAPRVSQPLGAGGLASRGRSRGSHSVLPCSCPQPVSVLRISPVTSGTFPAPFSLRPQDQVVPVAVLGRAGIWQGQSAAAHVCVPAGNICPVPKSRHWAQRAGEASWSCPATPGEFGQELMNFRPGRCGREEGDVDGDPLPSPEARWGGSEQRGSRWWRRRRLQQPWR